MSSTTLLTLPFLALISIPLLISAYITICFSVLALFLRLFIIYVELCYAIIANYFIIPTSNTSSLLNFAPSEPTTPAASTTPRRRSLDYGRTIYFSGSSFLQSVPVSPSQSHPDRSQRRNSSHSEKQNDQESAFHDLDSRHFRGEGLSKRAYYPSLRGFLGLISGDERRDFEGVGGWRCWTSSSKFYAHHSRSASSSSSVSEEADERAWLSINNRLELPSQPLGTRSSYDSLEHPLPRRHRQVFSSRPDDSHSLHHRRSATTSVLSTLDARSSNSLSVFLSTRPDHNASETRSRAASQHSRPRQLIGEIPSAIPSHSHTSNHSFSSSDGPNGYFALRPSSGVSSGATTPGSTTPVEERSSPRTMGRSMAHYPAGVRYRRRSISGPNSSARIVRS